MSRFFMVHCVEAFLEPLLERHRSEIVVVAHAPLIHVTHTEVGSMM